MPELDSDIPGPASSQTNNPKVVDGKLVDRRAISTASQAQQIGDQLVQADQGRDLRRSEIQRALNGAAPFNERTLKEKNQGHRFNISMGYLEGACGRAYAPYLDLGMDEEFLARIKADLDETKTNIIRKAFVAAVKKWGMWPCYYNTLVREAVDFGYCSAVFPDPYSPFWYPARQREGLVPERSLNVAAKLDLFCWRRDYRIHELYNSVEDEEAAKLAGWNIENVWMAMASAAPDDYNVGRLIGGREIFEQRIRAAALALSYGTGVKTIHTYHQFVAETSGKVSHWIVLDSRNEYSNLEESPDAPIELFKHLDEFEAFDDLVVRFDLEFGDGYWHGAKGLAQKLYGVHRANDRMFCSGLDQTFRGGLGVLKSTTQKGHESLSVSVFNDFVVLPPDYDAMPGVKMPTLDQTFFSMNAALLGTAVQRGGDVAPEAMGIERSEKTATQASIDEGQRQVVTKANLKRWVPSLSKVIDIMFRRLIDENGGEVSKQFLKDLFQSGITPEDIQKIQKLEVYHTVEDVFGETRQNISYIADKYRGDPDADRLELKKKEVGAWLGPAASLDIIPGDADQLQQLNASRLQTLEISSILDGMGVPVAPDDLHPVHVSTGINWINDLSKSLVQGTYNQKRFKPVMQDVQNIAAHLEQHIQAQASIKGQRESSRLMEAQLKMAVEGVSKAMQINLQQHVQAMQSGMEAALAEASQPNGESIPQSTTSMSPSPTATSPELETVSA